MHPFLQAIQEEVERGEALLVDVREQEEWEKGHLAGALFLPLSQLEKGELVRVASDKTLYLYCRRANRVKRALSILKRTHPNLKLIPWGFEDLWAAGFLIN